MMIKEATPTEEQIIEQMIVVFHLKREDNNKNFTTEYWWKWLSTSQLADHFGISCTQMRRTLKKMETKGLVHSGKISDNWLTWAPNKVEGYEQHPYYKDYLVKEGDAERIKKEFEDGKAKANKKEADLPKG